MEKGGLTLGSLGTVALREKSTGPDWSLTEELDFHLEERQSPN